MRSSRCQRSCRCQRWNESDLQCNRYHRPWVLGCDRRGSFSLLRQPVPLFQSALLSLDKILWRNREWMKEWDNFRLQTPRVQMDSSTTSRWGLHLTGLGYRPRSTVTRSLLPHVLIGLKQGYPLHSLARLSSTRSLTGRGEFPRLGGFFSSKLTNHLKPSVIVDLPFTYSATTSTVSLSGSMVMNNGVTSGRLGLLSEEDNK